MNSANDLTVTVSANYEWQHLREYAISLAMSGFKGTKLMCARGLATEAVRNFTGLGFRLEDFPVGQGTFFISRYAPVIDYIKKHLCQLRYIICTDCRDVVFQSDPSVWLERHMGTSGLLGCTLGVRIKDDGLETHWTSICVTPETLNWLKEEPAVCVGTIAGDARTMLAVLTRIYDMGVELSGRRPDFSAGMDEGLFNYILRSPEFRNTMRIPSLQESFAAQCGYLMVPTFERPWDIGEDGLVRPKGISEPYTIVHQFDRDERWKSLVQSRYTDTHLPYLITRTMHDTYPVIRSLRWKGRG